jgi:hypothetical protein
MNACHGLVVEQNGFEVSYPNCLIPKGQHPAHDETKRIKLMK